MLPELPLDIEGMGTFGKFSLKNWFKTPSVEIELEGVSIGTTLSKLGEFFSVSSSSSDFGDEGEATLGELLITNDFGDFSSLPSLLIDKSIIGENYQTLFFKLFFYFKMVTQGKMSV